MLFSAMHLLRGVIQGGGPYKLQRYLLGDLKASDCEIIPGAMVQSDEKHLGCST